MRAHIKQAETNLNIKFLQIYSSNNTLALRERINYHKRYIFLAISPLVITDMLKPFACC